MSNKSILHNSDKPPGIYVGVRVDRESRKKLIDFCETNNISLKDSDSIYEKRMHSTIFYSKESSSNPEIKEEIFSANPTKWIILESPNTQQRCLALKLECLELTQYHYLFEKNNGVKHEFTDYTPHISIHYNYKEPLPNTIPDFPIKLHAVYKKPLYFKENKVSPSI